MGLASCVLLASILAAAAEGEPADPSRVFYPRGSCETGWIGVEVYDRATGAWRPHPTHARVPTDSCRTEDSGILLNEIRIRCVDPSGQRAPSEWVIGAQIFAPVGPEACAGARSPAGE